jgi:hypothetical protein
MNGRVFRGPGLAALFLLVAGSAFAEGEVGREIRESSSSAGIVRVEIAIPIAELRIESAAGSTIDLSGTIRQKFSKRDDRRWAEAVVQATRIVMEQQGDRMVIRRVQGPEADSWKAKRSPASIRAVVTVPAGMAIEVEQSIGEIEVDGSFGEIDVKLNIGDVTIRTAREDVRQLTARVGIGDVHANLGDRIITKEGLFAGETLWSNDGGRHRLRADVRIGSIRIELQR